MTIQPGERTPTELAAQVEGGFDALRWLHERVDDALAALTELCQRAEQGDRMREALERIAGQDCERFTDADPRECVETKREPCDRCVALSAVIAAEKAGLSQLGKDEA